MSSTTSSEMQEPSIDTDKLSYEIFSILESKFLFGYDDQQKLWIPKPISPASESLPLVQQGDENPMSAIKNQRGKICILSIDSGGMRGILSGKALAYLEHALKSKSGNPNARIADFFDVAAGSGVGGGEGDVHGGRKEFDVEGYTETGFDPVLRSFQYGAVPVLEGGRLGDGQFRFPIMGGLSCHVGRTGIIRTGQDA
ncbi:hypothetical protein Gotri_004760, partial [Gossypium trilobum]|nr:hypothetical protein [Gossypium trilobum]